MSDWVFKPVGSGNTYINVQAPVSHTCAAVKRKHKNGTIQVKYHGSWGEISNVNRLASPNAAVQVPRVLRHVKEGAEQRPEKNATTAA